MTQWAVKNHTWVWTLLKTSLPLYRRLILSLPRSSYRKIVYQWRTVNLLYWSQWQNYHQLHQEQESVHNLYDQKLYFRKSHVDAAYKLKQRIPSKQCRILSTIAAKNRSLLFTKTYPLQLSQRSAASMLKRYLFFFYCKPCFVFTLLKHNGVKGTLCWSEAPLTTTAF